jgi:hypothetical protein
MFGVIRLMPPMNGDAELAEWRKARRSMGNGNCVEISQANGGVVIRDSKNPIGMVLAYSTQSWRAFTHQAQLGHFDTGKI